MNLETMLKTDLIEIGKRMGVAESADMPKKDLIKLINTVIPLRNDFAKHALTGLLANNKYLNPEDKHNMILEGNIFKRAFSMADGMIKESGMLK